MVKFWPAWRRGPVCGCGLHAVGFNAFLCARMAARDFWSRFFCPRL